MIKLFYFLLLGISSLQDYKFHRVNGWLPVAVLCLGAIRVSLFSENRWVELALAFLCFLLLMLLYALLQRRSKKYGKLPGLGGADVRLMPAMMLVQGWEAALFGVFLGLLTAFAVGLGKKDVKKEIPLIPWMTGGCALVEVLKKIIYFL